MIKIRQNYSYKKMKMKKLLTFFCSLVFVGAIAQTGNPVHHDHPHAGQPQSGNGGKTLKGFDEGAAWLEAKAKSSNPATQKEWFETLKRRFILEHSVKARGSANFNYNYDAASKTGFVNLNPYSPACPNAGFDDGNYNGWTGDTYTNSTSQLWNTFTPAWVPGIMTVGTNTNPQATWSAFSNPYPNRMTLMTIPPTLNSPPTCMGWDSIAISSVTGLSEIPFVPPSANGVTCRLGNAQNNYNETERIVYSMFVTPQNSQFTYSYAVVIYDGGHAVGEQPFFKITFKDQNGALIPNCGQYQIDATNATTDTSFHLAQGGWGIYYKKWTPVGMDLTAYLGTTVTMEFQTGDCVWGGHWCYAYIDAPYGGCEPAQATVNMCTGSATATLVAPYGYSNYQWYGPNAMTFISGATNDSLVVNNAVVGDVYTVSVISAAGCTTQMQTTLVNTNLAIQNFYSSPSCSTGFSGSATVIPTGSNAGYTYAWTDMSGNPVGGNSATVNGLSPGTYSVTITSPGCGQADTTVTVGISPPVYYTDVQNFCLSPAAVVAPAGSNYLWYDPSGNLIGGATTQTLTVSSPVSGSSYTTVFNNPSGCQDSVKITITQTVNQMQDTITYCGSVATCTVMPGAANVIWYSANWPYNQIGTGNPYIDPNPVPSTWWPTYYASYTNPTTGCQDSVSVYLTNLQSSIYSSNVVPTCDGACSGSVTLNMNSGTLPPYTLTVTGPGGYSYSNAAATATQNITGLCPGTYSASFTDGQCTATTTFMVDTIFVNVTTTVTNDTVCAGQTSTVTFNYGGGTPAVCGLASSGCSSPTIVTVGTGTSQNTNTSWPSTYGNWYSNEKYQILYTASDLLAAGVIPGKLSSIGFDVSSVPAGMNSTFLNYTIKIGCTSVSDLDPTAMGWNVPFVTGVNQVIWGPQNYTVVAGWNTHTFAQAWEWDGVSNIIIEICYDWIGSGNYTSNAIQNLTATGYNSYLVYYNDVTVACPQTTSYQVAAQRPNTRFGNCTSIAQPSDFTYNWSVTNGATSGTPPTVTLTTSATTDYYLSITTNYGNCTLIDTIPIVVVNPFTITMPASDTLCPGGSAVTLSATTTPAAGVGTWTGAGMTDLGNAQDGSFNPATNGTGSYYVYFTAGAAGCTVVDSVQMVVSPTAVPIAITMPASPTFCVMDPATVFTATTTGSSGTWSGTAMTDLGNNADGSFSPSTAGIGTYYSVFTALNQGCTSSDSVLVTVNNAANATFAGIGPFCITDNAVNIIPTNPGGTFNGTGITNAAAGTFNPSVAGAGTWPIEYVITGGCADSTTLNVVVYPQPVIAISSDSVDGCTPTAINFYSIAPAPANGNAQWFFGDGFTGNSMVMTHTYTDTGFFNVTYIYTDLNGCSDTIINNNMIQIYPNAVAAFTATPNQTTIIDPLVYFTNQSTGASSYYWQLTEDTSSILTNPVWNFTDVGTYNVQLIAYNQYGCNDTVYQTVIIDADVAAYIPNAFTPGDGNSLNDTWIPYISGIDNATFRLEVYDRWGQKIFATTDINQGWNGKVNNTGDLVQIDAYVYKIYFKDTKNKKHTRVGHVTVVR
jgi:gliding motility-associated-like protein